ncbi:MAG: hydantoinase/oxoprolinase family protein, partial [Pseudomonadota bacterium]
GQNATVTDADVALGLIDPEMFAEGRLEVDRDAAEQGLADQVGDRLQLDAWDAAGGVSEIVDEHMAAAARMHSVESGKDLGGRAMIAFGGNGPLHATRVARRSGVSRVIVPLQPGVGSAVGFLFAPVSFEIVRSHYQMLDSFDAPAVRELFQHLEAEAEAVVRAGAPTGTLTCRRTAFMRYRGQGHEVEIDVPDMRFDQAALDALRAAFEAEYSRQFSRPVPGMTIEILNWCLRLGTSPALPPSVTGSEASRFPPPRQYRAIRCDVTDTWVDAGLFWRPDLTPGDRVSGPALIVEPQTTTFVSGDFDALVDGAGNLHLSKRETPP